MALLFREPQRAPRSGVRLDEHEAPVRDPAELPVDNSFVARDVANPFQGRDRIGARRRVSRNRLERDAGAGTDRHIPHDAVGEPHLAFEVTTKDRHVDHLDSVDEALRNWTYPGAEQTGHCTVGRLARASDRRALTDKRLVVPDRRRARWLDDHRETEFIYCVAQRRQIGDEMVAGYATAALVATSRSSTLSMSGASDPPRTSGTHGTAGGWVRNCSMVPSSETKIASKRVVARSASRARLKAVAETPGDGSRCRFDA